MIMNTDLFNILLVVAILVTLLLILYLINIIQINDQENLSDEDLDEEIDVNELPEIDLCELTKKIEESLSEPRSSFTKYEEEQEAKSIISYDELLKTQTIPVLSYTQELDLGGLSVKTIDTSNLVNTLDPKPETHPTEYEEKDEEHKTNLISYDKEEEFLVTLKRLNITD